MFLKFIRMYMEEDRNGKVEIINSDQTNSEEQLRTQKTSNSTRQTEQVNL